MLLLNLQAHSPAVLQCRPRVAPATCSASGPGNTLSEWAQNALLSWFKNSEFAKEKHEEHVKSESVMHMIKGTPFASAPEELKLKFVDQPGGQFVSDFMQLEQQMLGDWKVGKIVEAAGSDFDAPTARQELLEIVAECPVVLFSFVDCPWCLAAKQLLQQTALSDDELRVVELEDLAERGKRLRAALALTTGRTSLPAVFVGGRAVGGFTDGFGSFDEVREISPRSGTSTTPHLLFCIDLMMNR